MISKDSGAGVTHGLDEKTDISCSLETEAASGMFC